MMIVGSVWLVIIGVFFLSTYFLYGRVGVFTSIGDLFIRFSFIKRTKMILLSYGLLAIFIGVIGLLVALAG